MVDREWFIGAVFTVVTSILFGYVLGATLHGARKSESTDLSELIASVNAVDAHVVQLASSRCMNVTTPVLNVAVYDVGKIPPMPKGGGK